MRKRQGPQMQRAQAIVAKNPGCTKMFVAARISPCPIPSQNWGYGYAPVDRAIRAGLILAARKQDGSYCLTIP